MNRYWCTILYCFVVLGCHGQKSNPIAIDENSYPDSVVLAVDSLGATQPKDVIKEVKLDSIAKKEIPKTSPKKPIVTKIATPQIKTTKIWNEEQINFLNQVSKILLFDIKITEIGSRKVELYAQLNDQDRQILINALLNADNYPDTTMTEAAGKGFEPNYQLLLEANEERLTLMFDKETMNMVVANLFGREKHAINPSLLQCIENLKKGE